MLAPGSQFPQFSLAATTTLDHPKVPFPTISNDTYKGKWLVVFFWRRTSPSSARPRSPPSAS